MSRVGTAVSLEVSVPVQERNSIVDSHYNLPGLGLRWVHEAMEDPFPANISKVAA